MRRLIIVMGLVFVSYLSFAQQRTYKLPETVTTEDYEPSVIVVKLRAKSNSLGRTTQLSSTPSSGIIDQILGNDIITKSPAFPKKNTATATGRRAYTTTSLDNIYKVNISKQSDLLDAINKLLQSDEVEYAEPYFTPKPLYVPNDPQAATPEGKQTYLDIIKAYDAWDLEKGDTSVVIGILDTGVDMDHIDLVNNIKYNYSDPINGIDDDNDGLIDNFAGWDIANNDNQPQADSHDHGTYVAGASSASTNNGEGIAGVGFNSTFLPIKIYRSNTGSFYLGYEAIALAADLGCKVINLSWGDPGPYSQYGQDIINYAVLEKDAAVIAAAGNTPAELDFYPASFDNVLSVSSTNNNDEKANFATYSDYIDLVAPGQAIYTTRMNDGYDHINGTSLSAPIVAGAVALVRARFPQLNAIQAMEKVRVTADDIYAKNSTFFGKLGKGRLNMLRTLTDNTSPSIRATNFSYNNGYGNYIFHGDTVNIAFDFINYLAVSDASTEVTLTSNSPYVSIIQNSFKIGSLETLSSTSNTSSPFQVIVSDDLPPNTKLSFRINFSGGAYTDFQNISITSSPDYITATNNQMSLTLMSNGDLGYKFDGQMKGVGLTYQNQRILDNIGIGLAYEENKLSDNLPINLFTAHRNHDFSTEENIKLYGNSEADLDIRNSFIDPTRPFKIEQKTLAYKDKDYFILEYRIINTSSEDMNNIHVGLFSDWVLGDKNYNSVHWDQENLLGYAKDNINDNLYAGVALLKGDQPIFSALDNKNFNGNSSDLRALIDEATYYNFLSKGVNITEAGTANTGNDVSQINGATISIAAKKSQKVTLVISAASSLSDLILNIQDAKIKYNSYLSNPPLLYTAYTCKGESTSINPPNGDIYSFYSDPELQNLVYTGESLGTDIIQAPQKFYVRNEDSDLESDIYTVQAAPKLVNTNFSINPDPILIDETGNSKATFTDLSVDAVSWNWNFGNGFTSNNQNPIMNYPKTGNYKISLTATNDLGCIESTTKQLEVSNKSNLPDIEDRSLCQQGETTLTASNASVLNFYSDALLSNKLYTGNSLYLNNLKNDTIIYVTSIDSTYESNAKAVHINISELEASFHYTLDTLNLQKKQLLHLYSDCLNETSFSWYINGIEEGSNTDLTLDYSLLPSTMAVTLLAEDELGCYERSEAFITPTPSAKPEITDISLCEESKITIAPGNGELFYFYNDASRSQLLHKGNQFSFDFINKDTILYVTGVDQLLESEPSQVKINFLPPRAYYTPNYTVEGIGIDNMSTNANHYLWLLNEDTISTEPNPLFVLPNDMAHELSLIVSNDLGCYDEFKTTIHQPSLVSSIDTLEPDDINIYPNPAMGVLKFSKADSEANIYSANGQLLLTKRKGESEINISHLQKGLYLVKIKYQDNSITKKLIKEQ
ncbi:S8 family serine peptidase [Fulvivirga sediminis]|uniref:S8 family serine peptidase n=1 Tax=Fulvivirga sediminis TaxID=2803949 RepID=A0A937F982_9BACT|nr:S8 family serine peptidase [Fulvivirga sediminis]MBL3658025.1 S8 family serine peptidase [Fulvivirga sediminis]